MAIKEEEMSKILVIDDDGITRKMLEKTLKKSGCDVLSCSSAEEGLEVAVDFKPEIVLLDVMMPGMDGYQACEELRKLFDHNRTKIIMLTGLNDVASVDKAFNVGANDFITKPINWSLLVMRVKYAARERSMYFKLAENESKLKQSQRMAGISYWEYDPDKDRIEVSGEFAKNILAGKNILTKDEFYALVSNEDREFVSDSFCRVCLNGGSYSVDHRVIDQLGNELIFQQQGEALNDEAGNLLRVMGALQDITKEKHASALIEYQKYYDELTGAPNKYYFYNEINNVKENNNSECLAAILFLGIDRFKSINASLGYAAGDEVLKLSVDRIKFSTGSNSVVCRYSGDNFAIVIKDLRNLDELELHLSLLLKMMSDPFKINNEELFISCSVGIVVLPMEEGGAKELTIYAEAAMNHAKTAGGNQYRYHSIEMRQAANNIRQLEKQVRNSIEKNRFYLLYQPQVDIKSNVCIGAEALIRMTNDAGEIVSPIDFIPIAEDTGLIVEIGYWIIETVCEQISRWESAGFHGLRIGINLSARQFIDPKLVKVINRCVQKYNVPKECVDIEITESIAMDDLNETLSILKDFKKSGYTISMDDFGTGHSSLSYLQQMPIDILKIDRAFIKDISTTGDDGAIAKTIIAMGHALNMSVIAEGAETDEHMKFLRDYHCDEVQGYYYSPPVSVDKFEAFYKKYS